MWLPEGVTAGVIAGVFMVIVSEILYRLGIFKSNLIITDGTFAVGQLKRGANRTLTYVLGIFIHLCTSAVFGLVYSIFPRLLDFDIRSTYAITLYVVVLWLAMLFIALPVAGQGILGRKVDRFIWAEQFVLHTAFGISFYWALGLF
jgi:hypothetical protein